MTARSLMVDETGEAPAVVRRQLAANAQSMRTLGAALRRRPPRAVVTCARGSSDNAATFAKYLIETHARVLTSSAAPSTTSVYDTTTGSRDVLFLAISQSGRSPDLIASARNARAAGALVVALCNTQGSALAAEADHSIDLHAGPERSVAATKSFIASLSALTHLVAEWCEDRALLEALHAAPTALTRAHALDWNPAVELLAAAGSLFVLGRGYGLGIAQEAALKLKETCALHAEAFSSAEVQHGPMALVGADFPIIAFSQSDETRAGIEAIARDFVARGARVMLAGGVVAGATSLPVIPSHPVIEPLLMIQSFYNLAAQLAVSRGLNPDVPPHLRKVTETT